MNNELLNCFVLKEVFEDIINGKRFTFVKKNANYEKDSFLLLMPMDENGAVDKTKFVIVKVLYCDLIDKNIFDLKKSYYVVAVDIKKGFNPFKNG